MGSGRDVQQHGGLEESRNISSRQGLWLRAESTLRIKSPRYEDTILRISDSEGIENPSDSKSHFSCSKMFLI